MYVKLFMFYVFTFKEMGTSSLFNYPFAMKRDQTYLVYKMKSAKMVNSYI